MSTELQRLELMPDLTLRRIREGDAEFLAFTFGEGALTPENLGSVLSRVRGPIEADERSLPVLFDLRQRHFRGDPAQVERFFATLVGVLGTESPRGIILVPPQSPWRKRFLQSDHPLFFPLLESEAEAIERFRRVRGPALLKALGLFQLLAANEYETEVRDDPLQGFKDRGVELSMELKSLQGLVQATGHAISRLHPLDRAEAPRVIVAGYLPVQPSTGLEILGLFELCLLAQIFKPGDFILLSRREEVLLERVKGTHSYSNLPYPIRYLQVGFGEEEPLLGSARGDAINVVALPPYPGQEALDRIRDLVYLPEFLAGQWSRSGPLLAADPRPEEAPSEYLRARSYKMQEYTRPVLAKAVGRGRVFVLAPMDEVLAGTIQLQLGLTEVPYAVVLPRVLMQRFRDALKSRPDRRRRPREALAATFMGLAKRRRALADGQWPAERPLDRLRAGRETVLSPRVEGLAASLSGTPYRIVEASGDGAVWWPRAILLGLRDPAHNHPDTVRILKGFLTRDVLRRDDTLLFGEGEGELLYVEAEQAGPDRFDVRVVNADRARTMSVSSGHPVLHLFHLLQELRVNVVFAGARDLDTKLAALRPAALDERRARENPDPVLVHDYMAAAERKIYRCVAPRLIASVEHPVPRTLVAVLGEDEILHGGLQEMLASMRFPYATILAGPVPETHGVKGSGEGEVHTE